MTSPIIWVNSRRYFFHRSYDTWKEAYNVGRLKRRRDGAKYFILKKEAGYWFPAAVYDLYLNKQLRYQF